MREHNFLSRAGDARRHLRFLAALLSVAGWTAVIPGAQAQSERDTTPPQITFTRPSPNGFVNTLSSITGSAIDDAGVTRDNNRDVKSVLLILKRNSDNKYWNGASWGPTPVEIPTDLREEQFFHSLGVAWSAPQSGTRLPSGSEMGTGSFTITAIATDVAGNVGRASMTVTADTTAPAVSIITPRHNTVVTSLLTRGSALETRTGSGVDRVRLVIRRHSDNKYWNGTEWVEPQPTAEQTYPLAALMVGSYNTGLIREFRAETGKSVRDFARGLGHPESFLFGPDQTSDGYPELYVCDRDRDRVLFYDGRSRRLIGLFARGGELRSPSGLAFMPATIDDDGYPDLLVATGFNGQDEEQPTSIKRYNGRTRAYMGDFVPASANGGVSNGFEDIVYGRDVDGDGAGDLYAAALIESKVIVYNGKTGARIRDFVAPRAGGLAQPTGMRFGPNGNLYVCSANSDDIKMYNGTSGEFIRDFVADNNGLTFGLDGPERLIFGPDGHLYVSVFGTATENTGNGTSVLRFNGTTGEALPAPGKTGALFVEDISGPAGLAFNPIATGEFVPPPAPPTELVPPSIATNYNASTGLFTRGSGLPIGDNLRPGTYTITATARDRGDNSASASSTVTVGAAPTVSITTPRGGARISALPRVEGTALGEGVETVRLYLRRDSDGLFWTGSGWGARTALTTTLTPLSGVNGVKFVRAGDLPSGTNLRAGTYRLEAEATNNLGLIGRAVSEFTVESGGGPGTSEVTLSQSSATAGTSTIRLVFTGTLDPATAADPSRYVVTINGATVSVERATYSASAMSVLLKVPSATLRGGDQVRVAYNLRDTAGRTVSGQSETFVANR